MEDSQQSFEEIKFEPHSCEVVGEYLHKMAFHCVGKDGVGRWMQVGFEHNIPCKIVHSLTVGHFWVFTSIADEEPL